MMKVRVIKSFRDKETKSLRKVGDVFACEDARFEEIRARGEYVELYEKAKEPESPHDAKTVDESDANELKELSMKELKAKAEALELDVSGLRKKEDIITIIRAHECPDGAAVTE